MQSHYAMLRATQKASLMVVAIAGAAATTCFGAAVPAFAYDASWHREPFWSGEYPHGFTMAADVTINIRERLDPDAPKSLSCLLKKGATYHVWNRQRVVSDQLEFVSFTKIVTYRIKENFTAKVEVSGRSDQRVINFKKGDQWSYLAYGAEGLFLFMFGDTIYEGEQELFKHSTKIETSDNKDQSNYDEWLKLKCANGTVGWIFFGEVSNAPGFAKVKIGSYGSASDEPQSQPRP